jgi:hypothetical protein
MKNYKPVFCILSLILTSVLFLTPPLAEASNWQEYVYCQAGDADGDGRLTLGDAITVLNYLHGQGPEPKCLEAADANQDRELDLADAVFILNCLFAGGRKPASELPPFPKELLEADVILDTGMSFKYCKIRNKTTPFRYELIYSGEEVNPDRFIVGYDIYLKRERDRPQEELVCRQRFYESKVKPPQINLSIEQIMQGLLSNYPQKPTPELLSNLIHLVYTDAHKQGKTDQEIDTLIKAYLGQLQGKAFKKYEFFDGEDELVYRIYGLKIRDIPITYYITVQKLQTLPALIAEMVKEFQACKEAGELRDFSYQKQNELYYLFKVYDWKGHDPVTEMRVNILNPPAQSQADEFIKGRIDYWITSLKMGEALFSHKDKDQQELLKKEKLPEFLKGGW